MSEAKADLIEYLMKRLNAAKEAGNRAKEGRFYGDLGVVYHCIGNFQQAIEFHKKQLNISKEMGDKNWRRAFLCRSRQRLPRPRKLPTSHRVPQ